MVYRLLMGKHCKCIVNWSTALVGTTSVTEPQMGQGLMPVKIFHSEPKTAIDTTQSGEHDPYEFPQ